MRTHISVHRATTKYFSNSFVFKTKIEKEGLPSDSPAGLGRRATFLPLCFSLLGSAPQKEQETSGTKDSTALWLCPKCAAPMVVVERLTAAEMQPRSPPLVTAAA